MSTNFVSTIVYEEGKIFKWLLKEQKRLVKRCKEERDSYYLIGSPEEYKETANHLDNQVEVEEILGFLCDANSSDDQYLHKPSEKYNKNILQIIRETIYSINQEQNELLSYAKLHLESIENHFKRYLPKSIIEDDEENEDKTILIEKGSDEKIPLDDNQCNNDIESRSTTNANNPAIEPAFNSIEEKKQESLASDDLSPVDIESGFTGNEINPGEESPLYSIEEKRKESLANDDPSAVEFANYCEGLDERPADELDIEMALSISELAKDIDKQQMCTLELPVMITTEMQSNPSEISPIKAIHDLAKRHKIFVQYQLEKESGPAHAKIYTMRLHLGDKQYAGTGHGIKLAQRAAAQLALEDHQTLLKTDGSKSDSAKQQQPSTMLLNIWATQHHIPTRYILLHEQHIPVPNNHPNIIFYYRLFVGYDLTFDGHGPSHQKARINCADHALYYIHQHPISNIQPTTSEIPVKSQISLMHERARKLGLPVQMEQTEPMTVTYHIGEEYSATGTGQNKQLAKETAAEKMLEILPIPEEKVKDKSSRKTSNQHQQFIEQKGSTNYSSSEIINPITRLYQIGRARNEEVQFIQIESNDRVKHFQAKLGENHFADGHALNKQTAKRLAAENLLIKLNILPSDPILSISLPPPPKKGLLKREESAKSQQEKKHVHFVDVQSIVRKEQLSKACEQLSITIEYQEQRLLEQFESILSLSKDDRLLAKFRGHGQDIDDAQENAAEAAWKNLHQFFDQSIRK